MFMIITKPPSREGGHSFGAPSPTHFELLKKAAHRMRCLLFRKALNDGFMVESV